MPAADQGDAMIAPPSGRSITHLVAVLHRQHTEFIRLLIVRDQTILEGDDGMGFEAALVQIDKEMTATERQLVERGLR